MGFIYQHISVEQRAQVGLVATVFQGTYGLVTALARELGTSRKFVYTVAGQVQSALAAAVAPRPPGPAPQSQTLVVDRRRLDRAIVTLALVAHAAERPIAACLAELYAVEPSVGYIDRVLQQASTAATAIQARLVVPLTHAEVEADELFAADKAHLVAVDHRSLLLLALRQVARCDTPAWAETWRHVAAQGVEVVRVGSDGGKALAGAIAQLRGVGHQLDLWHTLRRVGQVARGLEQAAYRTIGREWDLEKKSKTMDPQHAVGGYVAQQLAEARSETARQIARYEQFQILRAWVREAVEAVDLRSGQVRSAQACLADLQVVTELLRTLRGDGMQKLAESLDKAGPGLLQYVETVQTQVTALSAEFDGEGVRLLCWEWRCAREVGHLRGAEKVQGQRAWKQAHLLALLYWGKTYVQVRARVVDVLEGIMRGSSLAECVNSWLRPYADVMKGLGERFLPLFMLYRNSHVFARGKRAGHSPLELAGVDMPDGDWLDWIGLSRSKGTRRSVRSLPQAA